MLKRVFLLITILSVCLVLVGGCGKSDDQQGSSDNIIHTISLAKITGLDPANINDFYSSVVAGNIFEALYQYHYLKRPYQAIPCLAESMPIISDDGLTYTIKIKRGVLFHDDKCFPDGKGRELVAEDFIFSFKRLANIKTLSREWSIFDNKIVGLDEFREYTKTCKTRDEVDYSRKVQGLEAVDDYTLIIKLKRKWPQFIYALIDIAVSPIAKEAVDRYDRDIIAHPVGTGPFKLKTWHRGSYIKLVRNQKFRGEPYPTEGEPGDEEAGYLDDAGKTMPFVDGITWSIIQEQQPAWLLFMNGQIDVKTIPKDNFGEAIGVNMELTDQMKALNIKLEKYLTSSFYFLGFNMEDKLLGNNKPLRRAMSYAIDREKFIELFSNGRYLVANGIIPPTAVSYNPQIKKKGYAEYNPEKAEQLIQQAEAINKGKLPQLKVTIAGTDTLHRQMGQFLKRCLEDVGLDVEMLYMDWPSYLEKINSKSLQMFLHGSIASVPDAIDSLILFYSPNWKAGSKSFNYYNPQFDK
ncbi:MAG: hypothetical protein KAS96_01130, partial [Planctomycetes bacterium]|nr:hypothetical protein [Planctomycetota bacterium]